MIDSRRKGKRVENELCARLRTFFPKVHRNLSQYQGTDGRDFRHTDPFCIQLKAGAAPSWRKALNEATESAKTGEIPVGVTRQDRDGFFVHMSLEDFLHLYRWGAP